MTQRDASAPEIAARLERALQTLERLTRSVDRLNLLVEASKVLNSTLDLSQVFASILEIATRQTGADRATIFLVDAAKGELWSLLAQGLDEKEIRLPLGRGLAGWVAASGASVNLTDAHSDSRFDPRFDELFSYRTQSILVMPVKARDGHVVGVLELLNKRGGGFTAADIEFVEGISVHSANALENARLHRDAVVRQRHEQELVLARGIVQGLLPELPAGRSEIELAVRAESCPEVAGDYYDLLPLGSRGDLIVIADVGGRGASAALAAASVHATLHTLVEHVHALEGIAYHLNETLRKSTRAGLYLTAFLALVDPVKRTLHYINAGHPPPLLAGRRGVVPLREGGSVMGLLEGADFVRGSVRLEPGDLVLGYTDGITNATGTTGHAYGLERLAMIAGSRAGHAAADVAEAVWSDLAAHTGEGELSDDRVLLALRQL
ncbi:MAG: PP2C family protein-serine/threonine phosphatase [Vicinamibacteria bacterium]